MGARRIAVLQAAELTYPDVGMTRLDVLPAGYRSFHRTVSLERSVDFDRARHDLLTWQVQQRAGRVIVDCG